MTKMAKYSVVALSDVTSSVLSLDELLPTLVVLARLGSQM